MRALNENQDGAFPAILTFGGDHSIAMGSISAISNLVDHAHARGIGRDKFTTNELVVFWVDAHADMNTPSTTSTGNLHGCPVSLLTGVDNEAWDQLPAFDWIRKDRVKTDSARADKVGCVRECVWAHVHARGWELAVFRA